MDCFWLVKLRQLEMSTPAGGAKVASVADTSEELFDEISDTNFRGAYFTVQKAIPLLSDEGAVIFTTSYFDEVGMAGTSVVSATKAAVWKSWNR
jgi:NAD(P)-dependent dehydrogenase (short-subunit alcohol dehydrogenase family)